jgi:hypothetical protein
MDTKIAEALQQAKTCAPVHCKMEGVCFILAAEVERLHAQFNPIPTEEPTQPADDMSISHAEPTYDAPIPLWGTI